MSKFWAAAKFAQIEGGEKDFCFFFLLGPS